MMKIHFQLIDFQVMYRALKSASSNIQYLLSRKNYSLNGEIITIQLPILHSEFISHLMDDIFNFQLDEEENFYKTIGCSENSNVIILIMLYFLITNKIKYDKIQVPVRN